MDNKQIKGYVHSLESFGSVDGPGVRYVIFLSGCAMRCQFCHNPDTWTKEGGEEWEAEGLFQKLYRFKPYWKNKGGITVSGGEAMLQMEFVTDLFSIAKKHDIHTALDTSGGPFCMEPDYLESFQKLMDVTDLFILDMKEMDPERHKALTGQDNRNILEFARYLSAHKKPMWIRHVLVPGLTDSRESLEALYDFIRELKSVERVEILPYHTMGVHKWEALGIPYYLKNVLPPTEEEVRRAEEILRIK